MKPYFAKWLPVPGEYKDGYLTIDGVKGKALREDFIHGVIGKRLIFELPDGSIHNRPVEGARKMKLFLCSRDIKKGDTAYWQGHEGIVTENDGEFISFKDDPGSHRINNCYKILGEISPEATWVKEGDEFEEDDLQYYWANSVVEGLHITKEKWDKHKNSLPANNVLVKTKGPCGHYH